MIGAVPRLLAATTLTALVLGLLDALWLGVVSRQLYRSQLGDLLADSPNAGAAAAFYVIYVLGILHFVIRPGLERDRLRVSLRDAAAFGVVTYATWDLTSMAVFRDFPLTVVLVDIAWGAVLCTATTAVVLSLVPRERELPSSS